MDGENYDRILNQLTHDGKIRTNDCYNISVKLFRDYQYQGYSESIRFVSIFAPSADRQLPYAHFVLLLSTTEGDMILDGSAHYLGSDGIVNTGGVWESGEYFESLKDSAIYLGIPSFDFDPISLNHEQFEVLDPGVVYIFKNLIGDDERFPYNKLRLCMRAIRKYWTQGGKKEYIAEQVIYEVFSKHVIIEGTFSNMETIKVKFLDCPTISDSSPQVIA